MTSCDQEAVKKSKSAEFVEVVRAFYVSEEDQAIIRAQQNDPEFMQELQIFGAHDRASIPWRKCSPEESLMRDFSSARTDEEAEHILDFRCQCAITQI